MTQPSPLAIHIDEDIQLRLLEERYLEAYYALLKKNQHHLKVWEPWAELEPTLEGTREYMRQTLHQFADGRSQQTGIWYRSALVGSMGLHFRGYDDRKVEIGYWIDLDTQGKGIITRASRGLTSYAFDYLGMNKVEIHCAAGNVRSRAVPQRLGFSQDGVLRQDQLLHGDFVDIFVYSMLASDWKHAKS